MTYIQYIAQSCRKRGEKKQCPSTIQHHLKVQRLNSSSYLHPDSNISWNNEGEIKILLIHLQVETRYMKSVIYFHDVLHLSQICCHFISSNAFSYNVALNIYENKQALHVQAEKLLVWYDVFTFSVTLLTYIQNLPRPITGQDTKYSVSLVNWDLEGIWGMPVAWGGYLPIEGRQLSNYYMCKNIYHSHYSDCARSKCSSGWRIQDWYFHWYLVP